MLHLGVIHRAQTQTPSDFLLPDTGAVSMSLALVPPRLGFWGCRQVDCLRLDRDQAPKLDLCHEVANCQSPPHQQVEMQHLRSSSSYISVPRSGICCLNQLLLESSKSRWMSCLLQWVERLAGKLFRGSAGIQTPPPPLPFTRGLLYNQPCLHCTH